ncbi:MAG TPA: hypothetical protein VM120_13380 [Bryobacteraceae bacterium]|nr:hypothetical protein [Bryobacteraceae bacterium]
MKSGIAALAALAARGTVQAQGQGARALEGVWDVAITNPPGLMAPTRRLITYGADGTVLDDSGTPGEMPARGVWDYTGAGVFEGTWWRFARDAQGQVTVDIKVRSRIHMVSSDEYENDAKIDIFTPAGQLINSGTAKGHGRRIKLDAFD